MLPKETSYSRQKNNEYKFLQRSCVEEVNRCNQILGGKMENQFVNVARDQLEIINRLHVFWGDFLGEMVQ